MPGIDLNWDGTNEDGFSLPDPGVYTAEVGNIEVKRSATGDPYLSLQLKDADSKSQLCYDTIMLGGKGRSIGMAKLRQLGIEEGTQSLEPNSLHGRRVKVSVIHDTYEGRKNARVDIRADGFKCGYLAVENGAAPKIVDDDSTPF